MDFVDEYYSDKDLSLLRKLTLVIPTYNRNYYLSRCLWYHAHFPFGEIVVADSSSEEKKVVNRETVAKIREMFGANVRYLEYEPETEKYGGDIYRKWGDAVQYVETEYSQIVTDKEFLIPTTLTKILDIISKNSEYIAGHGKQELLRHYNTTKTYYFVPVNTSKCSETSSNSLQRFDHAIFSVTPFENSLLLAITKTDYLKEIYNIYLSLKKQDLRYGEIFLAYSPYIIGKAYCEDSELLKVRDEVEINHKRIENKKNFFETSESSSSRYPPFGDYLRDKIANEYYTSIQEGFTKCFHEYTNLNDQEILEYMELRKRLIWSVLTIKKPFDLILTYIPILRRIYHVLPLQLQIAVAKIRQTNYLTPEIKVTLGEAERIILKTVSSTYKNHKNDLNLL